MSHDDVLVAEAVEKAITALAPILLAVVALIRAACAERIARNAKRLATVNTSRLSNVENALSASPVVDFPLHTGITKAAEGRNEDVGNNDRPTTSVESGTVVADTSIRNRTGSGDN